MQAEVLLLYRRTNVDRCTGEICLRTQDGEEAANEVKTAFEDLAYSEMLKKMVKLLPRTAELSITIARADRVGLIPLQLNASVVELLKTDPVRALRVLNPTVSQEAVRPTGLMAAGHDALAHAFGDHLYTAAMHGQADAPCCGRTVPASSPLQCPHCAYSFNVEYVEGWACFRVEDLLTSGAKSFVFPRRWNQEGPRISLERLQQHYNEWLEARKEVS